MPLPNVGGMPLLIEFTDTFWTAFEAIGTVAAVFVAIALGIYPLLKERRNRPKLTFEWEPSMIVGEVDKDVNISKYYLMIRNDGPATARSIKIKYLSTLESPHPFLMSGLLNEIVSLQNGDGELFLLFSLNNIKKEVDFQYARPNSDGIGGFTRDLKNFEGFALLITGDNFPPIRRQIQYNQEKKIDYIAREALMVVYSLFRLFLVFA